MMPSFFDLMKYAKTGIASPNMTGFDKLRALAMAGGVKEQTLTGVPPLSFVSKTGKPLISWSMLGNGQQTGTPTPDAPIMPEFVGVRTGNLFDINGQTTYVYTDVSVSNNEIVFVTVGSGLASRIYFSAQYAAGTYTISCEMTGNIGNVRLFSPVEFTGSTYNAYYGGYFKDVPENGLTVTFAESFTIGIVGGRLDITSSAGGTIKNIMFNLGSTVLPYEPFGYKIPITCAGQTTPVYLGQTQTVRRIKKLVLTGEENWNISGSGDSAKFYVNIADAVGSSSLYCTHFTNGTQETSGNCEVTASKNLVFNNSGIATITGNWKTWLSTQYAAGTPVTVWYVLAEPETAIVNEPLCKIGDYADELHSTDAGVTIPTAKGANVLTVDTDLQPSAVSVTGHIKPLQ